MVTFYKQRDIIFGLPQFKIGLVIMSIGLNFITLITQPFLNQNELKFCMVTFYIERYSSFGPPPIFNWVNTKFYGVKFHYSYNSAIS